MGASYLLDIAILLAAAVVAIPIFRVLKGRRQPPIQY